MEWIIVTDCKHLEGYKLLLTFEGGIQKTIDLKEELWGEAFEPLRDVEYFKTVKVSPEMETIYWDNGADFAPEFLYEHSQDVTGTTLDDVPVKKHGT